MVSSLLQLLEQPDTCALVLGHLDPRGAIALGRTCRGAHAAFRTGVADSLQLLATIAGNHDRLLTKAHFMGFFALSSAEADSLPRQVRPRKGGGYFFLYGPSAYDGVPQLYAASGRTYATRVAERHCRSPCHKRPRDAPFCCATPPRGRAKHRGNTHRSLSCDSFEARMSMAVELAAMGSFG